MCPITKRKLYYLLKHTDVNYDELFKLESLEFKSSIDLEEFSEEEEHFIRTTFLRYLPHNVDEFEELGGA